MHKNIKMSFGNILYLVAINLSIILCTGCNEQNALISLTLPASDPGTPSRSLPLQALNKNAHLGEIIQPQKAADMYFLFSEDEELAVLIESGRCALELSLETVELPDTGSHTGTDFTAAFVYQDDLTESGSIKKNYVPRHPVTARIPQKMVLELSIGFAGSRAPASKICGFMLHAKTPVKLKAAAIGTARYGWIRKDAVQWYGCTADGGRIPDELFQPKVLLRTADLPRLSSIISPAPGGRDTLRLHFNRTQNTPPSAEQRLSFICGEQHISLRRVPGVYGFTIDGALLNGHPVPVSITGDTHDLSGITMDYGEYDPLNPITADPGLILEWPQAQWRQPAYEFFSWEQFPAVLIFDCADYAVQDRLFKRLAFYAEKKGFTGKLLPHNALRHLHAFNAHDYRAETLAAFFKQAEDEAFALNDSERELLSILLRSGIVIRTETGLEPGSGAVVSLSRQSSPALRKLFITHEGLHGIYFTEEKFRRLVDEVFSETDSRSVLFLRRYFEVNATLNYNTDDPYLLKNEFMAYILQQSSSHVQWYAVNRLSRQRAISDAEPELCAYIRSINAVPFKDAAEKMEAFLYAQWGLRGGRIHLADLVAIDKNSK
ncbi:MAG: hypothetical protein P1P65_01675 [Treponema sp.]